MLKERVIYEKDGIVLTCKDTPEKIEKYVHLRMPSDPQLHAAGYFILNLFLDENDREATEMWDWLAEQRRGLCEQNGDAKS